MIRFICEQCGKKLKARLEEAGARFECSRCGTAGRVPRWTAEIQGKDAQQANRIAAAAWNASAEDDEDVEPPFSFAKKDRDETELDMTPMVDVTFLLLIFFMITASFTMQKTLKAPQADRTEAASQRPLEEIEEDDDFIIINVDQDSVVWVDDREVPTRHELLARLRDKLDEGRDAPSNILITAHPDARYEKAVMCMDVSSALGIENARLAVTEEGS